MFIRNIFSYSLVNFYAQAARLLQELVIRIFIPPAVLGLWSLILVIQSAALGFDWGVLTAACRELPLLYGAKQFNEAANYRVTAFYLHIIGKICISLAIIIYSLFYYLQPFQVEFIVFIAAAIIITLSGIGEAFIAFYQSAQGYINLSKKLFLYWTGYVLLVIAGAYFAEVTGLIAAVILAFIWQAFLLKGSLFYKVKGIFQVSLVKSILAFALPFRLVDLPISLALVLDGLFVAHFFGLEALAIYMTAKLIFNQAGQVPTWIGNVFIIRATTIAGQGDKALLAKEMLFNLRALNLIFLPLLIGLIALISHWVILLYLPQYIAALPIIPLLLLSLYFQPRVTVIRNIWIIDKRFDWLAISNLCCISLMCLGFLYLYLANLLILSLVALVFALAFFGYFLLVVVRLGFELWGFKKSVIFFIEFVFAMASLIFAMWNASLFNSNNALVNTEQIFSTSFKFFAFISLLVLYGLWRLDILTRLKELGSKKLISSHSYTMEE